MADGLIEVLKGGAQEDKGLLARMQYFVGAIAVGDLLKSTLGPKGMDKILQPMNMEGARGDKPLITNDGATILKTVWLDNPSAKVLADVAMQQDSQCGDGTTGVVVLTAELLRNAEGLIDKKLHPQTICNGYRLAVAAARKRLDSIVANNATSHEEFKKDLFKIALTTLSSKMLTHEKQHFAALAVEAVTRMEGRDNALELIQILKKPGGTLKDSFLADGFILEKQIGVGQPKVMNDCKVMVANTSMDTDKIKIYGARVKVDSFEGVQAIEVAEREKMKSKVNKILASQCNVFINRQLIYNYPDQLFKNAGVMAIEHSDFDGMERLASILGAEIVSTFENPENITLGFCKRIEEMMIGEDKVIRFSGTQRAKACSIVLRGSSAYLLDEAERSLHDALAILSQTVHDTRVVCGGGASEIAMAVAVDTAARNYEGKESLAMEAFAKALLQIPTIILDNGGFDSAEIVSQLRALHHQGEVQAGIDIEKGGIGNMNELGILESYKSKLSQICLAAEAAEMLIRVDNIIRCAPRERSGA